MVTIAKAKAKINATDLAKASNFSRNHLAKIMQQLTKYGYLVSDRGPKGGFLLARKAEQITLLELFELVEGEIEDTSCMGNCEICPFKDCIFGGLRSKLSKEFKEYLTKTRLSDLI